mmetsp:Transcript_15607/g.23644  ORF Transcript_15607/g.23644 Transcript_15607/m.23644 type:complete len:262 (-) Transcript_15607:56-841(-)
MNAAMRGERRHKMDSAFCMLTEQDDLIFVIFGFVDFPTLFRMQRVCSRWKSIISKGIIPGMLGNKTFVTTAELIEMVEKYCYNKFEFADELARTYGWPIGRWNVSQITDFVCIFEDQINFNEDITEWDMSSATSISCMFFRARSFNQDLSKWNTSKVNTMNGVFSGAVSFNGDISTWDTSKVTSMSRMFYQATSFNVEISGWNTSQVADMYRMFWNATSFNQNISLWNVANVWRHDDMFIDATAFNEEHSPRFISSNQYEG